MPGNPCPHAIVHYGLQRGVISAHREINGELRAEFVEPGKRDLRTQINGRQACILSLCPAKRVALLFRQHVRKARSMNEKMRARLRQPVRAMSRREDVMGHYVIGGPLYWLGWLSTAAMLLGVLAMAAGMTFNPS